MRRHEEIVYSTNITVNEKEKRKRRRALYVILLVCFFIVLLIVATIVALLFTRKSKTQSTSKSTLLPTKSIAVTTLTTPNSTSLESGTASFESESTFKLSSPYNEIISRTQLTTVDDWTSTHEIECDYPFALSPLGNCVNLLIDILNCGTVGYICPTNYTSCSNGLCSTAPSVQLSNPIPIFTAVLNGSVDDRFYKVNIPFEISLYNIATRTVQVTTNGVLCFENCSSTFTETILPTSAFSGATALAYWDDLYVYANTSQGIYYQATGNAPNRTLIFEYYCSHYQAPNEYYHFQIVFFENKPNIVQYIYYDISDKGSNCTVGVQASSTGPYIQYSFQQVNSITDNMTLIFDTLAGTYIRNTYIL